MTEFQFSAHDLCITRLCQAANCDQDAQHGWALCERHDRQQKRGFRVSLNAPPKAAPPALKCSGCNVWKPDDEFPMLTEAQKNARGRRASRRGRYCSCHSCIAKPSYKPKAKAT